MIVRYGGFKIYPETVEKVIKDTNFVKGCAVIAKSINRLNNMHVAYVELHKMI